MNYLLQFRDWYFRSLESIPIFISVILFISIKNNAENFILFFLGSFLFLHFFAHKLLGVEYNDKVTAFSPNNSLNTIGKLFFAISLLAVIWFVSPLIDLKLKEIISGFNSGYLLIIACLFLIIMLIYFFIEGLIGRGVGRENYSANKILFTTMKLVIYREEKREIRYEELKWEEKENLIIELGKAGAGNSTKLKIDLSKFRKRDRNQIRTLLIENQK